MKKSISIVLVLILLTTTGVFAVATKGVEKIIVGDIEIAPPTESTINGVPESKIYKTQDITGPYFESYNPKSYQIVSKFKYIGSARGDNRNGTDPLKLEFYIERSERQGSEWTGSGSFTSGVKAGILAKLEATGGYEHKEYRERNEAVGLSGSYNVPAGQRVDLEAWYTGRASKGTLRTKYFDDNDGWFYMDTPINVKVHPTALEVEFIVTEPY